MDSRIDATPMPQLMNATTTLQNLEFFLKNYYQIPPSHPCSPAGAQVLVPSETVYEKVGSTLLLETSSGVTLMTPVLVQLVAGV